MPRHREKLSRTTAPKKTIASPVQTQTAETTPQDQTQHIIQMQRLLGNQASLRLLRSPAKAPIPIQHTAPKSYMKRALIQRNVMPLETWKDYSSGSLLSFRPDELKIVDDRLERYHTAPNARRKASLLKSVIRHLEKYKRENSEDWRKNKRAVAVDTLLAQAREEQQMVANQMPIVQLWGTEEFKTRTQDINVGLIFDTKAGLSGFQEEIIKRLEQFHKLKDPTGANLDTAIALLYQMKDMTGYWMDQNGNNAKRTNRKAGMQSFDQHLDANITTLEGYLGGKMRGNRDKTFVAALGTNIAQGETQSEKDKVADRVNTIKAEHAGSAQSLFRKLGRIISTMAGHSGEKTEINVELKFPVGHGFFVGGHLKLTAETDIDPFKKVNKGGKDVPNAFTKVHSDLTITGGWEIPEIAEVKAELGGYLETRGESPEHAMLLMSYAFYRRLMDTKVTPLRRVAGYIWGGYLSESGEKLASLWGNKVEKEALSKEGAYAELGGTAIASGKLGSKLAGANIGAKYQYYNGRKYTKKALEEKAKDGTKPGYEDSRIHEVKLEVGLPPLGRIEVKVKINGKTAQQIKDKKPTNWEAEAFGILTLGTTGWGKILEAGLEGIGMKVIELLREHFIAQQSEDHDGIMLENTGRMTSHIPAFVNNMGQNGLGTMGLTAKDNTKTALTSITGGAKDAITGQAGFSATFKFGVKDGQFFASISFERANESAITVGVFKADLKTKKRIIGGAYKQGSGFALI